MQQRHLFAAEERVRHATQSGAGSDRASETDAFVIDQGKDALNKPVRLYAQLAIDSARSIDSLFNDSLMTLAKDLTPAEKTIW